MGFLTWVGSLLGSSSVVDKLVDAAVNSKDEKASKLATERLEQLQGFKVVQRLLVGSSTIVFLLWALPTIGFAAFGYHDHLEWMLMISKEEMIYYPVLISFAAYLGGGTIESFKRKSK
jgi:hypothetical protein